MPKARGGKGTRRSAAKGGGRKVPSAQVRRPKIAATKLAVPAPQELIPGQIRVPTAITPGPRKTRSAEPPSTRLSNHKTRSRWFQARASWPVREARVRTVIHERARVAKSLPALGGTAQWEPAGPANIGGRLTSLVCHPENPDRIWAGAAGGGVWSSGDAGRTWQPQWHDQDVLNVGSLAIDPTDPNVLYCGTGEANLSADSYAGVGIYQTTDGGQSWHLSAASATTGIPTRIGVIAIDPFDRKHLRIGGVGFAEASQANDLGGMYTSRDGGVTWQRETFISTKNYWCHAILFDPTKKGTIYATFTEQGSGSGIYRTTDGGASWVKLTKGLPPGERFGRTSLAASPSAPAVLYAFAADAASANADLLLGVFRSGNGGASWTDVAGNHFKGEKQINYGNTIAVHPTNPHCVLCGGVDLHLTKNRGKTWTQVTHWDAKLGDPNYAHADHHHLSWPVQAPARIYDPNDGGLDVTDDGGRTWVNRSDGLAVTMFYDIDVAPSDGATYGGGAQDVGTVITTDGQSGDFKEILGGDGGWMIFDPQDAAHLFASYYNFHIFRFSAGATHNVSPPAPVTEQDFVWMCYIDMDPNDPQTLFTGSFRIWRTRDDAQSWQAVSAPLDGNMISAIEIAAADSKRIYAATEGGGIFRSLDGGDSWSANLASAVLPGHAVTRLATSPNNADVLLATVANFGHSHVFRSRDGGMTWEDVDKGRLPDVPHHSIAIPPASPATIYVASDAGVFASQDGGDSWSNLTRNLPSVMVVDLVYHAASHTMSAATYGRSIWRLAI
jgi:photosystem II stability/assembly factor-like uncharacterized protein